MSGWTTRVGLASAGRNQGANRRAFKRMSIQERESGRSAEWWAAFHASQRERVRARYQADRGGS